VTALSRLLLLLPVGSLPIVLARWCTGLAMEERMAEAVVVVAGEAPKASSLLAVEDE